MAASNLNQFLTEYIESLLERTTVEKGILKTGFDWVIYQLGVGKNWKPFRLPFFRQPSAGVPDTKRGEAEFGEDISFGSESGKEYWIFVLKDERLIYGNWTSHKFDSDLRRAAAPRLSQEGLEKVESVRIILAYNKDEDQGGIESYDRLIGSLPTSIGDGVKLSFERWNLTRIVEEIEAHVLTPDLLPQHLSGQFRYICSQFEDFGFGTREWENQLVPNWRDFLELALKEPVNGRKLRVIPVCLMILNHYRKDRAGSYPGWIDLIEWAMLALWSAHQRLPRAGSKNAKEIIRGVWLGLYIGELERYFVEVEGTLTTQHGFSVGRQGLGVGVDAVNHAYRAYWHLGRLGILSRAPQDFESPGNPEYEGFIEEVITRSAGWLVRCLRANPAALRPLVDLNHIELFLTWVILWQTGKQKDIYEWLCELESRLLVRRVHKELSVPFIEANSRLDLVAEYAATGDRPYDYANSSSYLLLMLLELCFSLCESERDELVERYMRRVVKAIGEDGQSLVKKEIDLQSWVPPEDWWDRILKGPVLDGIAVTTNNFDQVTEKAKPLCERIRDSVEEVREKHPWKMRGRDVPLAAYILACIKHRSPLPPEFWRGIIFGEPGERSRPDGG